MFVVFDFEIDSAVVAIVAASSKYIFSVRVAVPIVLVAHLKVRTSVEDDVYCMGFEVSTATDAGTGFSIAIDDDVEGILDFLSPSEL